MPSWRTRRNWQDRKLGSAPSDVACGAMSEASRAPPPRPPRAARGEPIPLGSDLGEAGALAFERRFQRLNGRLEHGHGRGLGLQQSGSGALLDEVALKTLNARLGL